MVEGYKQTEAGLIPEDWNEMEFGKVCYPSKKRVNTRDLTEDYPCVELEHISQGTGILIGQTSTKYVVSQKSVFESGDVLFGKLRPYLRKYLFASFSGVCTTEVWVLRARENIDNLLLFYYVQSEKIIDAANISIGTKMPRADWNTVSATPIPLPPTKAEQKAIATALNDTDALITALEKLIAKKKAIKQGAMQELLTPKDGWVEKNLGMSATLKARIGWQGLTTAEYMETGEHFLITGTDFKNGFIDWRNCVYVEKIRYDQDKNIQVKSNDVLVTKDGTIGKVAFLNEVPKSATLNSGVFVIRPIAKSFHPKFFYYILLSEHFAKFLGQLCAGSTINHLYQKDFVTFDFWIPKTIEEQKEISEILFDMDSEIDALEQKLEKQKHFKQGMMQVLLTGKIRLV